MPPSSVHAPRRERLVIASGNLGKLREFRELLAGLPFDVVAQGDLGIAAPEETGTSFLENALLKARHAASAARAAAIADDSGLEVDALGGAPGVRSARFAGERATDAENNAALLAALDTLDADPGGTRANEQFKARFRCVLALVDPFVKEGEPVVVEGTCEGMITRTPRGSGGFGYDPLFLVDGTDKTMAELGEEEKNRISHRGRAFAKLKLVLEKMLAERDAITRKVCG